MTRTHFPFLILLASSLSLFGMEVYATKASITMDCGTLLLDPSSSPKIGLDLVDMAHSKGTPLDLTKYRGKMASSSQHFDLAKLQKVWKKEDFPLNTQAALEVLYKLTRSGVIGTRGGGLTFPIELDEISLDKLDKYFRPGDTYEIYEVGLLRAKFQNGSEHFIYFSSKEVEVIDGSAVQAAGDLMNDLAIDQKTKVIEIDFFHSHPDYYQNDPTKVIFLSSRADEMAVPYWRGWALERWDASVPPEAANQARFFAIAREADGNLWLSQILEAH